MVGNERSNAALLEGTHAAGARMTPSPAGADRLGAMIAFVAVADRSSYADAAASLELSASTLSRKVTQLEERLGCRLFHRTTRQVVLTQAGESYLACCRAVIEQADAADAAAAAHAIEPSGTLRVGLPNLYGQRRIAPLLPAFLARHPRVSLHLEFDDRYADLIDRRLDVAVRIGIDLAGDYKTRKLAPNPRHICASPDYIARCGAPQGPRDISNHDCLHFSPLTEQRRWRLSRNGRSIEQPVKAVMISDNAEALRLAAVAGLGLALLAEFVVADDLRSGRLVPVLSEWTVAESAVCIVYPNAGYLPLKTRAFIDYLVESFALPE